MINDWISFATTGVCGVTAIVCLFEGMRRISTHGARGTSVLMVVLGGLFCATYGALAFWEHYTNVESSEALRQMHRSAVRPPEFGKETSAERREILGQVYARAIYLERGTLVSYLDRSGAKKVFAPSESDLKRREFTIVRRAQLDYASRESYADAFTWWLWGLLAALLGFLFSREKLPKAATPAAEHAGP